MSDKKVSNNTDQSNIDLYQEIIAKIENMTLMQINELIKQMEEKFNISSANLMPMMQNSAVANGQQDNQNAQKAEKSEFTIKLGNLGASDKISFIKTLRSVAQNHEQIAEYSNILKAKEFADSIIGDNKERVLLKDIPKETAEKVKATLSAVKNLVINIE